MVEKCCYFLCELPLQHLDLSKGHLGDDNLRMFVRVFSKYPEMASNKLNLIDSIYEHTSSSKILPKIVSMERITKINYLLINGGIQIGWYMWQNQ